MNYFLAVKVLNALNDTNPENLNAEHLLLIADNLKVHQTIWSKKLQPEQISSMIRLMYVLRYPNATSDDTEKALVSINPSFNRDQIPFFKVHKN